MPTFLELAGGAYPTTFRGQEILPVEGKSMLPLLQGRERQPHDQLFWEWSGNRAIREGDMKLVWDKDVKQWELYDLSKDRTETINLANQQPARVETMSAAWGRWAEKPDCVDRFGPKLAQLVRDGRVDPSRRRPGWLSSDQWLAPWNRLKIDFSHRRQEHEPRCTDQTNRLLDGPQLDAGSCGSPAPTHEYVVCEAEVRKGPKVSYDGRSLRTPQYKYHVWSRGKNREQLFDMINYPGEMRNLAGLPEYAGQLQKHRDLFAETREKHLAKGDSLTWNGR